jgi:protein-disulfide isomerase
MTRLVSAAAIALGLATTPALAFDIGEMTEDERAMFRDEVRGYLLQNPEVLMEAISVLEQRQAEAAEQNDANLVATNAESIFDDGYSHVAGNPDGDVTLVEFVDYRCGYCRKAFPELNELVSSDGDIRVIYKEFPILGEESVTSSRFAIATQLAHGEEAYAEIHDALMTLRANATEEVLARMADDMGYDSAPILEAMDDPEVTRRLEENHLLAQRLEITGTPTFVLGDQMVRGYVPLQAMRGMVEEVRAAQDS